MPIRARIKKVFQSSSPTSSESAPDGAVHDARLKDPNVYKPGEPMPRLKYRRPPDPEHKERLEAFSFGSSLRKKSAQSLYSPMGSRLSSRRNSAWSVGKKSNKSGGGGGLSRVTSRNGQMKREGEGEQDDEDLATMGLSRQATTEKYLPITGHDSESAAYETDLEASKTLTANSNGATPYHTPLSGDELADALGRTQLNAPRAGAPITA